MATIGTGTVSIDGAVTGLKTTTLIDELANVAAGSKKHKQSKLAKLEAKAANYATLNSRLGALDDALEAIETTTDFREYAVSLEDGAAFSVKATGEAIAGSYDVTVNSLAQAQIEQIYVDGSNSFASQTTALFSGAQAGDTFDITVDGELTQISITSSTNLATLASSIDDIDGLTAYVIQTATEEATGADAFALVVQADDTGKYEGADRFSVVSNITGGTASTTKDETGSSLQAAQNASVTISGTDIEAESNTITSIQGLTFTLNEETAVADVSHTATVTLDTAAMSDKVSAFVDAFNGVVSFISTQSKITSSGTNQADVTLGSFVGESTPRVILNRLRSLISKDYSGVAALGLSSATDKTALSQMGVKTLQTGLLSFSSEDFIEALEDHQADVELLFSDTSGTFSDDVREELDVYIDPISGVIEKASDTLDDEIELLEDIIAAEDRRIVSYKARLRLQFNALETLTSSFNATSSFLTSFFAPKTSK